MTEDLNIDGITLHWNCLDCCITVEQPLNRLTESGVERCPDCGVDDMILTGVERRDGVTGTPTNRNH